MWVADWSGDRLYAFNMTTKARDSAKDFDTLDDAGYTNPGGIWSDGETMWVTDWSDDKIYAYSMATRDRVFSIRAAGIDEPIGIWSDGETMWVTDFRDAKLYAYALPAAATPTNVTAETNKDGHVVLRWDDPDDDSITGYRILWRDRDEDAMGQFHVLVEDTGSSETGYTDRYVTSEARYSYRVVAISVLGVSGPTGPVDVDIPGLPAQPQGLTATAVNGNVSLTWDDPEDPSITGYKVLRRNLDVDATGEFRIVEDDTGSAETAYVDESVEPNTRYSYRVTAMNAAGDSHWSSFARVDTPGN